MGVMVFIAQLCPSPLHTEEDWEGMHRGETGMKRQDADFNFFLVLWYRENINHHLTFFSKSDYFIFNAPQNYK